jgi:hypothetical protein
MRAGSGGCRVFGHSLAEVVRKCDIVSKTDTNPQKTPKNRKRECLILGQCYVRYSDRKRLENECMELEESWPDRAGIKKASAGTGPADASGGKPASKRSRCCLGPKGWPRRSWRGKFVLPDGWPKGRNRGKGSGWNAGRRRKRGRTALRTFLSGLQPSDTKIAEGWFPVCGLDAQTGDLAPRSEAGKRCANIAAHWSYRSLGRGHERIGEKRRGRHIPSVTGVESRS